MRVVLSDDHLEVRLAAWQRALGLMRNIRVARADLRDVELVDDPVGEAMSAGVKVGLRIPWFYFVARTIRLDRAFIVRRGVPALAFGVHNGDPLVRVLVSTSNAAELVRRLQPG